MASAEWIEHAHLLQQVVVRLQGTRHAALRAPGKVVMEVATLALNQCLETAGVRVVNVETLWTASGERHERGLWLWHESNPK